MSESSQPLVISSSGRAFACSAAAVIVYAIDEQERFLLLRHPQRAGWEVVNGGLEAGETVVDGVLREVKEEAGPAVRVQPISALHIQTFHYDEQVRFMLSLSFVVAYQGGEVLPGDDMTGSEAHWFTLEELLEEKMKIIVPPNSRWLFPRALQLYRMWRDDTVVLQPPLPERPRNKYMQEPDAGGS